MENNEILNCIKSGDVKMRPRWYFILHAALAMIGGMILLFLVVYLISFIIFIERQTGAGFVTEFGLRGWARFLVSLPWLLILLSLVFIGILELLVRRYAFAYRRPLMYSALGIIVIIGVSSFVVINARFHERFEGSYPRFMMHPPADINPGDIQELSSSGFILTGPRGEVLHVMMTSSTRWSAKTQFEKGDRVVVFGDRAGTSSIDAFGIRKISR